MAALRRRHGGRHVTAAPPRASRKGRGRGRGRAGKEGGAGLGSGQWALRGRGLGGGNRLGRRRGGERCPRRLRRTAVLRPGMEWPAGTDMAEKQNPVDYGVQIRFINDLQEPKKPPKARAKPGSYGVAVRVQGIAGQPFVVLNSGEKGSDSFGVQIKSEGAYTGPPAGPRPPELPPGPVSPDSELPENPYVRRQPSWSTSDEEPGGGVPAPPRHKPPTKRPPREELRRTQSHGNLLTAHDDEEPFAPSPPRGQPGGPHQPRALSGSRSSSMLSVAAPPRPAPGEVPGFGAAAREPSSDSEAPGRRRPGGSDGSDIDTKPLSSVDSLISKFDGKVQQRGRAARRGRIPSEERKRSQSLDGRVSHRAVPDGRELSGARRGDVRPLPSGPTGSLGREQGARPAEEGAARSQRATRGTEEPPTERLQSKARAELQFKSTPDLLRDQREVAQPGSSEHTKELIYSILKEGSRDSETSLKRKTALVFEKVQELTVPAKDAACSQPQHAELARKVEELQERLDEETKLRQKLELTRDPARSGTARALEARLQEAEEESQRLRAALEKKGQELQRSLQELAEAKAARGRAETRLGEREEQLAAMREELGRLHQASGASPDREALYKELLETREELEEALSSKQRQEEHLRLRERELTALKGALKEEVANHDKELDRVRQQYQSDMDQLRRSMEGISQDQASLESEKQKISAVVRNLQRELEESTEETGHWRDMFQKNKDELRTTKQELLQVKLEREEFEEELRELRERFSAAREEADQARSNALDPGELEALKKELRQAQEAQRELVAEKQEQDERLRQRERELAALQGTMREEASSRDGAIERYRRDLQQLQKERDEAVKEKASLESERESSEQARKAVESTLRELQEQKDDLRRKVLGMETQLKEYERMGESWEGSQARLKEKVTKLEAERRQMEESLGESTDREQELLMAKRSLETRLDEAQRSLARLTQEHQELSASFQEEQRQKEQLKRAKSELEEQKRLLDRTTEKLNKELEQMAEESNSSLAVLKSQLEEFKEKSRKEITDSQKQAKDRGAEVEKMQFSMGRLQDEVSRLKQALQDSQAERESALLDKEVLLQRLHNLEQEADAKRRSQDDRSRQVKALEEKSKRLEVELDEERTTVELLTERVNRSRDQIDQLRAELLQERSSRQDLECDKVSLERQNKELKNRLASSEGLQKPSGNVSQLEARVEELQDRLQAEEREKNVLLSSTRKLERKVKELTIQIDDERQHVSDQKDQLSLRVKALKRQVDEAEEEIERLEAARKKAQRELEEQHELNEQLQARIKTLEKEAWRKAARSAAESSLQDEALSSDEELDSAYGPSSIASLLNEANLQTSSC
ncbi:cingulin [Anas platyrhynchos]|uniref:cingulin n=1 Tax=Anas platyrhynchos TaxID=8839 RepID=UPI003AF30220